MTTCSTNMNEHSSRKEVDESDDEDSASASDSEHISGDDSSNEHENNGPESPRIGSDDDELTIHGDTFTATSETSHLLVESSESTEVVTLSQRATSHGMANVNENIGSATTPTVSTAMAMVDSDMGLIETSTVENEMVCFCHCV